MCGCHSPWTVLTCPSSRSLNWDADYAYDSVFYALVIEVMELILCMLAKDSSIELHSSLDIFIATLQTKITK